MMLTNLPAFGVDGCLNVVIETPKGSRNKLAYDSEIAAFRLKAVLPEGSSFPFDFGFIPSTRGPDGDPLDVLLLLDSPLPVGCLIEASLIGVIHAKQHEKNGKVERNDRLVAVATRARTHTDVHDFAGLRPGLIDEVAAFFAHYNSLSGRRFEMIGKGAASAASDLVKASIVNPTRKQT